MASKIVTREQILEAFKKYPFNGFTKWVYKYYSTNLRKKPAPIGSYVAIVGFIIASIGMITFDQIGIKYIADIFASIYLLFAVWGISLPAYIMKQINVKRICKHLGLNSEEYNRYLNMYNLNN